MAVRAAAEGTSMADQSGNVIYVSTAGGGVWKMAHPWEAHDVRLNGVPLIGPRIVIGPGRLEFVAQPAASTANWIRPAGKYLTMRPRPADGSGTRIVFSFTSIIGTDFEIEIGDDATTGPQYLLTGRLSSAVVTSSGSPAGRIGAIAVDPSDPSGDGEKVTFVIHAVK